MKLVGVLARAVNSVLGVFKLHISRTRSGQAPRREAWSHERSPELLHSDVYVGATYSPWLSDSEFLNAYKTIRDFTLVDMYRCYELWHLAKQTASIEGSILEVGIWRGGTGCLLAMAAPSKVVYLADTFEGVVKVSAKDTCYVGGEHADTSEQVVWGLLASVGVTNAHILKGIFPDETGFDLSGPISLLHVDVDVYQSGKDVISWGLPRLPVGAMIIFDDFGFYGCEGITRLVHELRQSLRDFTFVHNLNGHAIFVRISKL